MMKKYLKLCIAVGFIGVILALLMYPIVLLQSLKKNQSVIYQGEIKVSGTALKKGNYVFIGKDKRTAELIRDYYLSDSDTLGFDLEKVRLVDLGSKFRVFEIVSPDSSILFIETEARTVKGSHETVTGFIPLELTVKGKNNELQQNL
ncbi:hypothetical protein [Pontibacter litorisediminis]|uniref:hypothetical protein n=1 Tax=Pontibacter litorisediminis TaxID=1846260 RepID=UPI0023ECF163|nr:hypothetical protein [Pontibacter litorisediminis]